jgi:hypothetical protein
MRNILLLLLFFGTFSTVFAQTTVQVKVTVTNSADQQNPKVNEIVSKVNLKDLKTAMEANYSLQNRESLTVHLAFYDKSYIGKLTLKNENLLTEDQYVTHWKSNHPTGNHILFLFVKRKDNADFEFGTLDVSPEMEDNHLFTEVMNFIRANLSGSPMQRVEKGTKYLANAIRPVWDKDDVKKGQALALVGEDRYKIHHFNFFNNQWAGSSLLTLEPLSSITNGMIKINSFRSQTRTVIPNINIFVSTVSLVGRLEMTDQMGVPYDYFSIENIQSNIQMNLDNRSVTMIEQIDNLGFYSETLSTAQWAWDVSPYQLKNTNNLRTYKASDNFTIKKIMAKGTIAEGQVKPPWIGCYNETYCNLYASDLAREKLFQGNGLFEGNLLNNKYAPWGKHGRASEIHDAIKASSNFIPIKIDENVAGFVRAWELTNAGYVVYLTAYNRAYYATTPGEIHPGHIATCFPNRGMEVSLQNWKQAKIIQAGDKTDLLDFDEVWESNNFSNGVRKGNRQKIQAHLYLGYILN